MNFNLQLHKGKKNQSGISVKVKKLLFLSSVTPSFELIVAAPCAVASGSRSIKLPKTDVHLYDRELLY